METMMTVLLCASLAWALILVCLTPSAGPAAAAKQRERNEKMDKAKEKETLMDLIVDAKRADPETGALPNGWRAFCWIMGVVAPPCRVGDFVWSNGYGCPCASEVARVVIEKDHIEIDGGDMVGTFSPADIGKTVFLTRDEAEAALAKMREEGRE